jgi:tetratricopeptide (TPR) repeat protein
MIVAEDITKKRVAKLTDKGIDLFAKGKYQEVLQIADELEGAKGALAFYLAAQAYAGLKDMKSAVAQMKRGVLMAPHIWMNWFYLGICLAHFERNENALAAYHQALLCPLVEADLVRLNMGILSIKCREYERALSLMEDVHNPSFRWGVEGTQILALEGVGRLTEAAALAEGFLRDRPESDAEYTQRVGFVAAALARIRLRQGSSAEETRSFLMQCLEEHGCSGEILNEIRNLNPRCHKEAKYMRLVVAATLPVGHLWRREAGGYHVMYDVVTVSTSEALTMIHEFESHLGVESLEVVDSSVVEERPEDPLGVYWITERVF